MKNYKQTKIEKKREQILTAASIVASEKGYHSTTMEDIATQLEMTKGSVYYYFENKQTLFFESQKSLMKQCIEAIQNILDEENVSIEQKFENAISHHITFTLQRKSSFELMQIEKEIFTTEQTEELVRLRDKYGYFYDGLISSYLVAYQIPVTQIKIRKNLLLSAMNGVIRWFSPTGEYNLEAICQLVTSYVLSMIRNEMQLEKIT